MSPLSTSPAPPPMPKVALISPMPGRDPLGRELVADDPEREREDGAADALDRAAGDQHRRSSARARRPASRREETSVITSTRSLPNMSPRRPTIGVATEAVSR